jgi:hypothetical protein
MFGRYLKEVFSTGWGIFFLAAGAVSTSVTFILIYRPGFALPYWVPGALSITAWLVAPYKLYKKQWEHIDDLEAQQQQRRRATLLLIEESGSFYIRRFTPTGITPKSETGMYLELWVSIENKGERSATITHYDLLIDGMGQFLDQRPAPQNYVLGRNVQHALNTSEMVKNYIDVPAERLAAHQHIPFMLNAAPPADARQIRCELKIMDTEGNIAATYLNVVQRGT